MNAPTLIVGLGGAGSKIAERVAAMVSDEDRETISFAVFDTDVNDLAILKKKFPFIHTIQTSTSESVGEALRNDPHSKDTWFPVNPILNSKKLTEGAGQVRAISRLAFESAVRSGKLENLHKAISELFKLDGYDTPQALRVIIVSSLAGGTGSGLILPVALYIQHYLATSYPGSSNITRGFFLLPEVFYGVIPGQPERNNIKCNAYATLRELDAFLMKGDKTLPEKYTKSVRIDFPSVSSNEYEEYNIRPYDFCFLFDAQNADGNKLNSHNQYLDHAASCIYAQSIGPMNKRSNSSEDNVIRKLVEEKGRNRYGGAGTSMLVYPVDDITRYLSIVWTRDCVSEQWMRFDKAYWDQKKEVQKQRKQGVRMADVQRGPTYINAVDSDADNNDPLANIIKNSLMMYESDGITEKGKKWDEYIKALKKRVKQLQESGNDSELSELKETSSTLINKIIKSPKDATENNWETVRKAYVNILTYQKQSEKRTPEFARSLAYSMFDADAEDDSVTKRNAEYQLETYLKDEASEFIHPCAVRYFLYKIHEELLVDLRKAKSVVRGDEDYFAHFADIFDDPKTKDIKENENQIAARFDYSGLDKIFNKLNVDLNVLLGKYREYLGKIDEYRQNQTYIIVLERGVKYVKDLTDAFESFFDSFTGKLSSLNKEIYTIEGKYRQSKGMATRYVCATSNCLSQMRENMSYSGGTIELDGKLSESIYLRVRGYAALSVKPEDYFDKIFNNNIVGFFKDKLLETYGQEIKIDILTAIEKEAQYENHYSADNTERITDYVKEVINYTKVLAVPFIEKPMGAEKHSIPACTYNKNLRPDDDSPRSMLIDEQLADYGGVPDEDIPINKIIFYNSFYGLRANELSKFAPPMVDDTGERPAGEYFKAYYELVEKIHPIPTKSSVVSPHIDRWWHNVVKMPDLDEENSERQLDEIYSAFFWGLVRRYIELIPAENQKMEYRLAERLFIKPRAKGVTTLEVSNGTTCNQLYEILDALAIYPQLVNSILRLVKEEKTKDINLGRGFKNNRLMDAIRDFRVQLISDTTDEPILRSVFDIPFMLKQSMTSEMYDEEEMLRLIDVIISEMKKTVREFSSTEMFPGNYCELINDQFRLFVKNTEKASEQGENLFRGYIFGQICEKLIYDLEDMGFEAEAKQIETTKNSATKKKYTGK